MGRHSQSITDVTLDNENVVFKGIRRANFHANREAAHHCIGSSASPGVVACIPILPLSPSHTGTRGQQGRESYLRKGEGFCNLSEERQSNHCLTIHICLNTTKGEELFKLGIGFGLRTDSHKVIIDKFQLAVKR